MIWVLLGEKPGDNVQALRLARALGLPFQAKTLVLKSDLDRAKPKVEPSLDPFDQERSEPLEQPWPDLVLTIGRRLAMAGLWIKAQSGSTKLALIGAPKGLAPDFDLVIAPLQYRIAAAPNVMRIGLPLLVPDPDKLAFAARTWAPRFAGLTRPLTAVFVGGSTGARSFTAADARNLLVRLNYPGTIYIVTSRRTPAAAISEFENGKPDAALLYRWRPEDPDNPYFGLLALADQFVVTGDSLSMIVEVARLGKPLAIAPMRERILDRLPLGRARDFESLHRFLEKGGWAVRLGQPLTSPSFPGPPDDTERVAARLRSLLPAENQRGT